MKHLNVVFVLESPLVILVLRCFALDCSQLCRHVLAAKSYQNSAALLQRHLYAIQGMSGPHAEHIYICHIDEVR